MVNATPWPLYTRERDPVPIIVQEAGWAPGPVLTGAENLATTGIRTPDGSARSESVYLLSYPGPRVPLISHTKFMSYSPLFSITK